MVLAVSVGVSSGYFNFNSITKGQISFYVTVSCAAFHLPQDTIEQAMLKLARSSFLAPYRLTPIFFLPNRPGTQLKCNNKEIWLSQHFLYKILCGSDSRCSLRICAPLPQCSGSWEGAAHQWLHFPALPLASKWFHGTSSHQWSISRVVSVTSNLRWQEAYSIHSPIFWLNFFFCPGRP